MLTKEGILTSGKAEGTASSLTGSKTFFLPSVHKAARTSAQANPSPLKNGQKPL